MKLKFSFHLKMNGVLFSAFILLFYIRVITPQTFTDLDEEEYQFWEITSKTTVHKLNPRKDYFLPHRTYLLLKTSPIKNKDHLNSNVYKFVQKNVETVPVTLNITTDISGYQRLIYSWLGKYSSLRKKLHTARIMALLWDAIRKKKDRILYIGREMQDDESRQFIHHFSEWFSDKSKIKKFDKSGDMYEIKTVNNSVETSLIPINEKLLHEFHCYVLHTQKKIHVYNSSQDSQCDKFANCLAKSINDDRSALFENIKIKHYKDINKFKKKLEKAFPMSIHSGKTMEHIIAKLNAILFGKMEILTVKSADNTQHVFRNSTKHSLDVKKFAGFNNCYILKNRLVNFVFLVLGEQCALRDAQFILEQGEFYYANKAKHVTIVTPHKPPTSFLANFEQFKAYMFEICH